MRTLRHDGTIQLLRVIQSSEHTRPWTRLSRVPAV